MQGRTSSYIYIYIYPQKFGDLSPGPLPEGRLGKHPRSALPRVHRRAMAPSSG